MQQKGLQFKKVWESILKSRPHPENYDMINEQFNETQEIINIEDNLKYKISYFINDEKCYRNIWIFQFRSDNEIFKGKQLEGLLYFPPDYPKVPPEFFFGHFQDESHIKHINIYLSNELCVAILNTKKWNPNTQCIDILKAIANTFDVPNQESPANAAFASCPRFIQDTQQKLQSEKLKEYQDQE